MANDKQNIEGGGQTRVFISHLPGRILPETVTYPSSKVFRIYPERPRYYWSLTNWIWQVDAISRLYRSRHDKDQLKLLL